jgi:hypothetical protein
MLKDGVPAVPEAAPRRGNVMRFVETTVLLVVLNETALIVCPCAVAAQEARRRMARKCFIYALCAL